MKLLAVAAIAALGAGLCGCATVIKGTTQTVNVSSPPVWGARCVLFTENGYYWDVITPNSVTVPRSREDLNVICTKRGFKDARAIAPSQFNFVTFGNAIAGGVTGVIIDGFTGANDSYPHDIEVPMERTPRPVTFSNPAAPTS
jgi:hypothetical protein